MIIDLKIFMIIIGFIIIIRSTVGVLLPHMIHVDNISLFQIIFLSMSGIVTFPKSNELRDIFSLAPVDRILVETDSPYLAPVPHRGKSNEPAFVSFIAQKGAEILHVDEDVFRNQTTKNFFSLFKKAI